MNAGSSPAPGIDMNLPIIGDELTPYEQLELDSRVGCRSESHVLSLRENVIHWMPLR